MTFLSVAQGIRSVIAKHANYSTSGSSRNTTIGDYTVLDSGVNRAAVIVWEEQSPTGTGATPLSRHGGYYSVLHNFTVQVFHRYTFDEETVENILADGWDVMTIIDKYDTLDGTSGVVQCEVKPVGPMIWGVSLGGVNFAQVNLLVNVTEEFSVTFA